MQLYTILSLAAVGWFGAVGWASAGEAVSERTEAESGGLYEVRTAAGEVFRGELLGADESWLVFRSLAAGELRFPVSEVTWVPVAAAPVAAVPEPLAPEPVAVEAEPSPPSAVKPRLGRWKRSVEVGYAFQAATVSRRDVYARAELGYEVSDRLNYRARAKYLYGEQEEERSTDRLEAGLAARQELGKRWSLRGDLGFRNDHLRDLDAETTGVGGVQYRLFDGERLRLSLGPGAGFRYRETDLGLLEGTRFNVDFVEEGEWRFNERLSLTQTAMFLYDPSETETYRVRNQAALSVRLSEHVKASMRFEHEFDRARPRDGSRSDQRVFSTLGLDY